MPLVMPTPSADVLAAQAAQQLVMQALQTSKRTADMLDNGIPARHAQEARELPDGRVIAAVPAVPAISAAALRAAIGEANVTKLEAARSALLG